MTWTIEQLDELAVAGRRHGQPHVRVKALAVRAVAQGATHSAVATMYSTTRQSVGVWVRAYRERGVAGFGIAPGRGRRPRVDLAELQWYASQSPQAFGIARSRWTLKLLATVVPSLQGFSAGGVRQALHRGGFTYKRGQPWLLSPDPEFAKKGQS